MKRILSSLLAISLVCSLSLSALASGPQGNFSRSGGSGQPSSSSTQTAQYDAYGNLIDPLLLASSGQSSSDASSGDSPQSNFMNNRMFAGPDEDASSSSSSESSSGSGASSLASDDTLTTPSSEESTSSLTASMRSATSYPVTYSVQDGGKLTIDGSSFTGSGSYGNVDENTALSISATADTGYKLDALVVNNRQFGGGSYTVSSATSISAIFVSTSDDSDEDTDTAATYTLSIGSSAEGSITVKRNGSALSDGSTVTEGDQLVVSATANSGWAAGSITIGGDSVENGGTYTVKGSASYFGSSTLSVTAGFQEAGVYYRVSYTPAEGGQIEVSNNGSSILVSDDVKEGSSIFIKATPNEGYDLTSLTINGDNFTSGNSYTVTSNTTIAAVFTAKTTEYAVCYAQQPNGTIQVTHNGSTLSSNSKVSAGESVTISVSPDTDYALSFLQVNDTSYSASELTNNQLTVTVDATTTISALFSKASSLSETRTSSYYAVSIPSVNNATVTASVPSSTPFYSGSDGSGTTSTSLSEGGSAYVLSDTVVTFKVTTDSSAYYISSLTNTASGGTLKDSINSRSTTLAVTTTQNVTLGVNLTTRSASSSSGKVYEPIAVQDDDGEDLEDVDGDVFDISSVASDGRLTLDGVAPGQTFYIKLGESGFNPYTSLDCDDGSSHYASASDLTDTDFFKISLDKDGDGKSLITSITQVGEKNLDGTRGSYLKVVLKDSTTTEELKATAEITFKSKKALTSGEDGNDGEWCKSDTATLDLVLWINNSEASDSADTGERIYIDPEDNEYNTFVWGDDRAALEFYADDDAEAFYARLSTKSDVDIYTEYGDPVDAELWFYNFVGNPTVPSTSRAYLTLGIPWDDDDYEPENVYIYELSSDGTLTDVTDRFTYSEDDYEIEGWTIKTRVLGTYVVSDTELDLDTYDYTVDYDETETDTTESYESLSKVNPVTGGGDYYYTPVAEPAGYTVATAQGTNGADSAENADAQTTQLAVKEAIPTASDTDSSEKRSAIPVAGILLTLLCLGAAGGAGYYFYRRGKQISDD